ncbi:MAG: lycopene cyclase domain-containing protein [bacterium]|nr:lycopene cyclase domain-containing protein [bacterium]
MYEYLVGCAILSVPWFILFFLRKDLRKPMIWSGLFYMKFLTIVFILLSFLIWVFSISSSRMITPGYWEPKTIFDLGKITNGYAVEDALFMFIVGGVVAGIYEAIFHKKISRFKVSAYHFRALMFGSLGAAIVAIATNQNFIYSLIAFGFLGAIAIWVERPDLIPHSLWGGIVFTVMYFLLFSVFNSLFPDFILKVYHLENLSGVMLINVPIEELLYALSFGLAWSPIYEYEHAIKAT